MTIANSRMTLGAILGSVATAADTVTSTFDALNKGIGMGNRLISDAAYRQSLRSVVDQHTFKTTLIREKAQEETLAKLKVLEFINKSADNAKFYEESFNELDALLNKPANP